MKINEIDHSQQCACWHLGNTDVEPEQLVFEDRNGMVELLQPYATVDMAKYALNEVTYKELASGIDGNFLNQKVRADALKGIRYVGFDDNVMNFMVNSSKFDENHIQYKVSIMFDQWDELGQDTSFNFAERARMLLWVGDIRLHCTDPSFLYWGYQYILTVFDASIYPEERPPRVRNPGERGIVCKHLNRVLRVLPFHSGEIATELKRQFGI